jgi:flagella basal body P-ring formation protein FlgA
LINKLTIILVLLSVLLLPALTASGEEGYQVISGDLILEVAKSYILTHSPWDEYDVSVGVKRELGDIPAYLQGKIELKVEQSREGGLADINLLKVRIDIGGEPYTLVDIAPYLTIDVPVVVAACDIERGRAITSADLEISKRDLVAAHLNDPITDTVQVAGMAAKQSIKKGDPIQQRFLELPILVERGKDVTVVIRISGLDVTITMQALDNGRLGDSVRVKNKSSGAIVTGEVIGNRLVEIGI